jgi:hypothetical protein
MGNKQEKEVDLDEMWEEASKRGRSNTAKSHTVSTPQNMAKGINVKFDENGKLVGIPEIWVKLLKISEEMVQYSCDTESLDEAVIPKEPDEKVLNYVHQSKPGKFIINIQSDNEEEEKKIQAETDPESETGLKGLPDDWNDELKASGFAKDDVLEDPMSVLETIGAMRRQKTGSLHPLPTNSEYRKREKEKIVFIKSDPSKDFIILEELGEGGFGKVYK